MRNIENSDAPSADASHCFLFKKNRYPKNKFYVFKYCIVGKQSIKVENLYVKETLADKDVY
jgi:hypothetical protein